MANGVKDVFCSRAIVFSLLMVIMAFAPLASALDTDGDGVDDSTDY